MSEVATYGSCEPENIKVSLEALRKGDVGLNAASGACFLRKGTWRAI
jgi:hypothetical protein